MNDILAIILKDTCTLSQLNHRIKVLKSYLLTNLFGGQAEPISQTDLNWLNQLPPSLYQQFNKDNVYELIAEVEKEIDKLMPLVMHLPFETNDEILSYIGLLVRKTFAGNILILDIKHDPKLIAGCALSWKGVYKDYSLRAKIEERKEEVLAGFKKYLR